MRTTIPLTVVAGLSTTAPSDAGTGSSGSGLPFTGLNAGGLAGLAVFSMLAGLVLLVTGRRRRPLA